MHNDYIKINRRRIKSNNQINRSYTGENMEIREETPFRAILHAGKSGRVQPVQGPVILSALLHFDGNIYFRLSIAIGGNILISIQ